jgi:hypothetical protein
LSSMSPIDRVMLKKYHESTTILGERQHESNRNY